MSELAIPNSKDVALNLPSAVLYQLEQAGSLATEILDERVALWAEKSWTQRQMAEEMGCSQQAVSKRLKRLGIETEARKRGEGNPSNNRVVTQSIEDEDLTEADVEVIDTPTPQYLPDLLDPDAENNTRTQIVRWFELGRHIQSLFDTGSDLNAKSRADLHSIQSDADLMCLIARRIREEVK